MTSVTITSTPATITSTQIASTTAFATEILSMSEATAATVPGSATAELAAAASSLLAQVITFSKTATIDETLLPSMVHSAPASRKTFSSVLPLPIFTNATIAAPASTGFAPTVTPTRTFNVSRAMVSASKAPTYNSSKTTTASATTTEALVVSQAGTPAGNYNTYSITTTFNGAPQYTGSSGLVWSLLVGLAANVAFLI